MENLPESNNRAQPSKFSTDFIILVLFLLIGGVMFLIFLTPQSDGIQNVKPTVVPTLSHSAALERFLAEAQIFNASRTNEAFKTWDLAFTI
jgi:hypothetical protein